MCTQTSNPKKHNVLSGDNGATTMRCLLRYALHTDYVSLFPDQRCTHVGLHTTVLAVSAGLSDCHQHEQGYNKYHIYTSTNKIALRKAKVVRGSRSSML